MKAKIRIEKVSNNGSRMIIEAECDTPAELEEITRVCKGYAPRPRILGIF
jgi:hypothetical protein